MTSILNLDAIRRADFQREPYEHMQSGGFLREDIIPTLSAEFPKIREAGFHPASEMKLGSTFKQLIDELEGPELTTALSEKFGEDFSQYPRLVTIRYISAAHEGRIHCDGKSKVMSLLLYMNEGWQSPDGRLRVLKGEHDFNDYTAEIPPDMGTVFAFMRRDHSWHGHTPFVGERRVVQVAWVKSLADIERKRKRHKISKFFKKLLGQSTEDKSYAA